MSNPGKRDDAAACQHHQHTSCHCCPDNQWHQDLNLSRRNFLASAAVGGAVLSGLSWASLASAVEPQLPKLVAERMPGFHWMTCYGDYMKEPGYALRRAGIAWDNLNQVPTV